MHKVTIDELETGRPVAQGEVNLWLEEFAPKNIKNKVDKLVPTSLKNGKLVLGHSVSGHHHVLTPVDSSVNIDKVAKVVEDDLYAKLEIIEPCKLVHHSASHAHKTLVLPVGKYIRMIRREATAEGWRKSAD